MRDALLEREFEIRALELAFDELRHGRGSVVVVEAAAGLGKTTLIGQAGELALRAGFAVWSARGAELEHDFTFGVVRQLFEPALPRANADRGKLFTGAARATTRLFAAAELTGSPGAGSYGTSDSVYPLLNGLYWLLVNLAETTPVVMLVDDAQWADSPSLRFLGFLARRVDSVAVTVIVASRSGSRDAGELLDDLLTASGTTVLEPKELSALAVAELVRRTLGRDANEEFCAACHAVTVGNPLYVRELLRVLAASGTSPDAAAAPSVRVAGPEAVRRHVVARLRRQPADVLGVARAVAVLGDDTDLALVARQADLALPAAAAAAGELVDCGIFERVSPPDFVHGIIREVVLSVIPAAERQAAHERAALILREAGEPVARIASHLLRTIPDGDPGRVDVLLAAAHQARMQGSPGGAAVYLRRARDEPPPSEMRSEVSRLLGNCQAHHLALADAEVHLREALSLADSAPQRALCAYSLARFRSACGAPAEAADLLSQAVGDLPAGLSAALETELEAELIGVARADLARRRELLDRLASFQRRPDAPAGVRDAHLSVEAMFDGEPADGASELARRALAGDHLPPDRSAIWVAVHTLMVADRLDEAARRLNAALDTAVRRGHLFPTALIRGYLARVAFLRGDLAQAREHVEIGIRGLVAPNLAFPVLHATQVDLLVEDGRLTEAASIVRDSVLPGDREPTTVWQLWLLGARARLHAAQGSAQAALADAVTCEHLYRDWGATRMLDVPWRLQAADAHCRLGDLDRAAALVDEHLRLARAFGVARHIGVALREAARLASSRAEASRLLREAIDLLQGGPARLELARTLEQLGITLLGEGDRQGGWAAMRRSAELAAECRAPIMAERLHALLADSGAPASRPHLTGIRAFTLSERRVAQLVVDGLTNRQIAEKLFLSEKTVEAHLGRAYRKLGVRTRTQLAMQMAANADG